MIALLKLLYNNILAFHPKYVMIKSKVVPEGWAVTITAQPSGTTLVDASYFMKDSHVFWALRNKTEKAAQ